MIKYILALLLFALPAHAIDMDGMLEWIAENSDYETANLPPMSIRTVTLEDLQTVYYGRLPRENEVFLTVEAIYFTDEVWIRDGIDPESNAYKATILHELVHHAQEYSDKTFPCVAASEADAYELGTKYARDVLKDESLIPDPLVVMMITQCSRF